MILLAGSPAPDGTPTVGPASTRFFDNTDVAIWFSVDNGRNWEARPVRRLPRYNDYNLGAVGGAALAGNAVDHMVAGGLRELGELLEPGVEMRKPQVDADEHDARQLGLGFFAVAQWSVQAASADGLALNWTGRPGTMVEMACL